MAVLTVSNSLTLLLLYTHISHIQYTYKVIFCHPDSLQCYECATLAASVFQLPSAPGSSSSLMVLGRENTTAVEGKDSCCLTVMSHKAVIVQLLAVTLCMYGHAVFDPQSGYEFGSCDIMWNVLLHNKYIKLGSCYPAGSIMLFLHWNVVQEGTHVSVSKRVRQRWEGEKRKKIERLPTGNTRGISVKCTLEEDGLKLSVCSFLNVKSFSNRGTWVGVRHFLSAAQAAVYFYYTILLFF